MATWLEYHYSCCLGVSQFLFFFFKLSGKKFSFTFLQRPNHLHLAVGPLELIKEGAHFELVDGSSPQLTDHHPVFPRGAHFHDAPLPLGLAVISRSPVKHLVTLDVGGLLLNLVAEIYTGAGEKKLRKCQVM